jgi:hypothetical protein
VTKTLKRYRVYFNRAREWPQCWSVDEGTQDTEVNVCGFQIDGCAVASRSLPPGARTGLEADRHPFAWLEVDGVLTIDGGHAVFATDRA